MGVRGEHIMKKAVAVTFIFLFSLSIVSQAAMACGESMAKHGEKPAESGEQV